MSAAVDHITFRDALDHLEDYSRANASAFQQRLARRAILQAMAEMGHNHRWSYYHQHGRLNTNAPYSSGTVEYDHSGGVFERVVTLTPTEDDDNDEGFPAWATYGHIEIAGVIYTVSERRSSSNLQLSVHSNPGADIAAGTSFVLFRDCYVLPVDFQSTDKMHAQDRCDWIQFVKPAQWLQSRRCLTSSSGTPSIFSVKGSTDFQGCMEACFYPYPDTAETIDFMYHRRPRKICIENYEVNTASVTAATKIVTGDATAFEEDMVGAIIRLSSNKRDLPTSKAGGNVYDVQRMVMEVTSATVLVVDQNFPENLEGVKYVISDVIDIEQGSMGTVFFRTCEAQYAMMTRLSDRREVYADYQQQLIQAREADSRSLEERYPNSSPWYRTLSDHRSGPDEL